MNRGTYNLSSKKRVTKGSFCKFHVVLLGKDSKKVFLRSGFPNKNGTQQMPNIVIV